MSAHHGEIVLLRHVETEWSRNGRHTGRTDVPLTDAGRALASEIAPQLARRSFAAVLVSPLRRARETCEICGLGSQAQTRNALMEWDYGDYEGLTSPQIDAQRPGWSLWRDGCPGGESAGDVGRRADTVIAEVAEIDGDVAIFSHGHILRVLAARWIELDPASGARLILGTGACSVLGQEHDVRAIASWNLVQ
jgi:broad specificity phosphatase PhoE